MNEVSVAGITEIDFEEEGRMGLYVSNRTRS
jgi:hypothetical protein